MTLTPVPAIDSRLVLPPSVRPRDERERAAMVLGPVPAARRDDVRRALGRLAAVRSAGVPQIRRMRADGDVIEITWVADEGGTPLAVRWGTLTDGQVVSVLVGLTQALAALHSRHLTHGCVCVDHLDVDATGSVVLRDVGCAWILDAAGDIMPPPAVDVAGVADLVMSRLGRHLDADGLAFWTRARTGCGVASSVGSPVGTADAAPASLGDPGCRAIDVSRIGAALELLALRVTPEPLARLEQQVEVTRPADARPDGVSGHVEVDRDPHAGAPDGAAHPSRALDASQGLIELVPERRHGGPTRQRVRARTALTVGRRSVLAVAVVTAVVGIVVALGTRVIGATRPLGGGPVADSVAATPALTQVDSASSGFAPTGPSTHTPITGGQTTSPGAPSRAVNSWRSVVASLDRVRLRALRTVDIALLSTVVDPVGLSFARYAASMRRRSSGVAITGGVSKILSVSVISRGRYQVVVNVTDRRQGYRVRTRTGSLLASAPSRGPTHWRVVLTAMRDRWRVFDATRL